ncbi:DUF4105 domain-containing protein [Dysgonomonas sp. 511]|nr:DUF4105 domain-containing protein [Dysgonomonas sp. 511]
MMGITPLSDSAQVSLLTSTPWNGAIYALYGHTAIRVNDTIQNIDLVYNYGVFNFNAPNFLYRFVKGETDYIVLPVHYEYYLEEYKSRGVGVVEQVFNLTQEEKQAIFDALVINSLPENRVYRYNYFYDNCSTRPRDIVEKCIKGKIEYTPTNKKQTYRDLVHEHSKAQPWSQFGIDLVIGADADKVITDRQKDFLPLYLMNAYEGAIVQNDTIQRGLLLSTNHLLEPAKSSLHPTGVNEYSPVNSPFVAGCILLFITLLVSFIVYINKWVVLGKIYDTLLFLIAGLAGCIIFFLMFFSEHPCTNPNWNIAWLNPLQLVFALLFFVKSLSKLLNVYHFINFVVLLAFLLAWSLIPQQLEIVFIPYILSLMVRSLMNITSQKKTKKRADYSLPKRAR